MNSDQWPFYTLHEALLNYRGNSLYTDVLVAWVQAETREREWLGSFKERQGNPIQPATSEELWGFYALSRVFELLLLRFQSGRADESDWDGPPISVDEYQAFAEALGFASSQPALFSPFYHEVVEVKPTLDPTQPANVLEYRWPCLMLGNMLFARAGVCVSAGKLVLSPGIADLSTLYWAYRRKNRPFEDLSHGWGHNSQWRTAFRRDYCEGGVFYYNVDGTRNLATFRPEDQPEEENHLPTLSAEERIELLTNRCFVVTTKPDADRWPYDDTLRVECQPLGT